MTWKYRATQNHRRDDPLCASWAICGPSKVRNERESPRRPQIACDYHCTGTVLLMMDSRAPIVHAFWRVEGRLKLDYCSFPSISSTVDNSTLPGICNRWVDRQYVGKSSPSVHLPHVRFMLSPPPADASSSQPPPHTRLTFEQLLGPSRL
jgi:hypothetical protein